MRILEPSKIIYAELAYRINGILFEAHNRLGRYSSEKQYADYVEALLDEAQIPYSRELILPPSFQGELPGRNKVDFLVDNKLILELKTKRILTREDYHQAQRYLKALNLKLCLLVNFRDEYLKPKRVLNSTGVI